MRLVYKCHYDGNTCDKEIPKVDENGNVILPKEYKNPNISSSGAWETCMNCDRNCSMSGTCYGRLEITY